MSELFEAYEYLMLETEQRAAWLLKTFGKKLASRFYEERFYYQLPEELKSAELDDHIEQAQAAGLFDGNLTPEQAKKKELLDEAVAKRFIEWLMGFDPTPNKIYVRWIVNRLLQKQKDDGEGNIVSRPERMEDINELLTNTLAVYQQAAASRRVNGNIDEFKSFADLFRACEPFIVGDRETSAKKDKKNKRDTSVDVQKEKKWSNEPMIKQAEVIYDSDNYIVLVPKTHKASRYFGKATNWCTTTAEDYHYRTYSKDGPLYIILRRRDGTRWQFHFASGQFCDTTDRTIDVNKWIEENHECFIGMGSEKFFQLVRHADWSGKKVDLKWFTPEMLESYDAETLSSVVEKKEDLKQIPKDKLADPKMLTSLCKRYFEGAPGRCVDRWQEERGGKDRIEVIRGLLGRWANNELVDNMLPHYPVLLMLLPEKFQTQERKSLAAECWAITNYLKFFIPEPWPEDVYQIHYDHVIEPADQIPERFRTKRNMALSFERYSAGMHDAPEWANKPEVIHAAVMACNSPSAMKHFMPNMPEKFRTDPAVVKIVLQRIRDNNLASEREWRDDYLSVLSTFPEQMWPKNAPKMVQRMIAVTPDFFKLPEHYQTPEMMNGWLLEHPRALPEVPAHLLTKEAVVALIKLYLKDNELPPRLDECDINIVKPEWVIEGLKDYDLVKLFKSEDIPPQFMTEPMIHTLLEAGVVPFSNQGIFTKERMTPRNISIRFNQNVRNQMKRITVQRNSSYGGTYNAEVEVPNEEAFKKLVDELPDWVDLNMAAKAATAGRPLALCGFPDSVFNADVLTKWVSRWDNAGYQPYSWDANIQELFRKFPESAYTVENAPSLVKHGFLKKLPDHLHSDDTTVEALTRSYSEGKEAIKWNKVTTKNVIDAIHYGDKEDFGRSADAVAYKLKDGPKQYVVPLIQDPEVSMEFIKAYHSQTGYYSFSVDDFRNLYKDKKNRSKWTEAHYLQAAGRLIPVDEIPEKMRTDKVLARAVTTRPHDIHHLKNPAEFMTKHKVQYPGEKRMLRAMSRGVYPTADGWGDASKLEHYTVKGTKGYYTVAEVYPRGHALFIFDDKDRNVDTILSGVESGQEWDRKLLASDFDNGNGNYASDNGKALEAGIKALAPYRMLLDDAFRRFPKEMAHVNDRNATNGLNNIHLYQAGGRYMAVEHLPRQTVKRYYNEEGTTAPPLTYVKAGHRYSGGSYWFFSGESRKPLGRMVAREDGRGFAVEKFFCGSSMVDLINHSNDFARFLSYENAPSGQSQTFKESELYTKLGVRGPGRGEWYSLLETVVFEDGPFRLWRSTEEKSQTRYCVTHDDYGTLVGAKRWKDGDFGYEVLQHGEPFNNNRVAIQEFLAKAAVNVDNERKVA